MVYVGEDIDAGADGDVDEAVEMGEVDEDVEMVYVGEDVDAGADANGL